MVTEQPALTFAGLLRQLRAEARLTQEELAAAAGVSPRSVSNLERGINRTAHKDTAVLLAGALGLTGPAEELFVAAARGNVPAAQVLAAADGRGAAAGSGDRFPLPRAGRVRGAGRGVVLRPGGGRRRRCWTGCRGCWRARGCWWCPGRRARGSRRCCGRGCCRGSGRMGWPPRRERRRGRAWCSPRPGRRWMSWRCGWRRWRGRTRRRCGGGWTADPGGFALTARQAALARPPGPAGEPDGRPARRDQPPPQRRLLLVVDQFEELFTQCAEEGQRRAFITALHAAATAGHGPDQAPAALVVLGVRADFEARCADYPQLAGPVQDRYLVTAMTERQLRMAITEPAKKAGSEVDDDLTGLLLAEVRTGQPGTFGAGVLPLLSHALDQAWRSPGPGRRSPWPTMSAPAASRAPSPPAPSAPTTASTPAQQAAARQVFTAADRHQQRRAWTTADRATRAELTGGKSPAEAQDVEAVLEAFAAERLLTLAAGTVELSHEALLTAWPLLRDTWLADTHADRIVRTRLHTTAAEWARHSRDRSYLYSGSLLQAATGTAARIGADPARHPPLSQTERDFLHASSHAHRRTVRRRQGFIALLMALVIGLASVAAFAFLARQDAVHNAATAARNAASAERQHAIALSRQLAAESLNIDGTDPVTARRLAVAAWAVSPTGQAASAITTLLAEQQQQGMLPAAAPVQTCAVS